jgi:hypothetical protein
MSHSLDGAFARINRAKEHVAELKRIADAFEQAYHDAILVEAKPKHPGLLHFWPPNPFPIPKRLASLSGRSVIISGPPATIWSMNSRVSIRDAFKMEPSFRSNTKKELR